MPPIIKIGDLYINLDHVVYINDVTSAVSLSTSDTIVVDTPGDMKKLERFLDGYAHAGRSAINKGEKT